MNFPCVDVHDVDRQSTIRSSYVHPAAVSLFATLSAIYFWAASILALYAKPDQAVPIIFCATVYSLFAIGAMIKTLFSCREKQLSDEHI